MPQTFDLLFRIKTSHIPSQTGVNNFLPDLHAHVVGEPTRQLNYKIESNVN